ncbi:MAG: flagellar basal body P-ring formation chaperone FlgA [Pseudomonadota bacterium]|nr:flagellar basal body P-ring formation chaperone FlgA [Pseudomonadota bacterium]
MRTTILVTIVYIVTLGTGSALAADGKTTSQDIIRAVRVFLQNFTVEQEAQGYQIEYEAGSVDSRIALAPCPGGPAVSFHTEPMETTRPTLLVHCDGQRPWKMYVTASVEVIGEAVVAARPIGRGERLAGNMLATQPVLLNERRKQAVKDPQRVIGMEARRPISTGVPVTADLLTAPPAVSRGDHVIIRARSGRFSVASRGEALAEAAIGEQVLVKNLSSSKTLRARVTAPGRVEVAM